MASETDRRSDTAGVPPPLSTLVDQLAVHLDRFRPDDHPGEVAVELTRQLDRAVRLAEAGRALAAARVACTGAWRADGSRSARAWLARLADLGVGEAGRILEVGAGLDRHPATDRAARTGEVSFAKIAHVTTGLADLPDDADVGTAEARLLEAARSEPWTTFRTTWRDVRFGHLSDDERHQRQRRRRRGTDGPDPDTDLHRITFEGPPDDAARITALFEPWVDQRWRDAQRSGEDLTREQARWDALLTVLHVAGAGGGGPDGGVPSSLRRAMGSRVKVIVRIDHAALQRGAVGAGEVCTINGVPAPVAAVRSLLDDGAFVALVSTSRDGIGTGTVVERVLHLARRHRGLLGDPARLRALLANDGHAISQLVHRGRAATAHQRTALEWLHPTCSVPGCGVGVGLEIDHTVPWASTSHTTLAELDHKCRLHHRRKTQAENQARGRPTPSRRAPTARATPVPVARAP